MDYEKEKILFERYPQLFCGRTLPLTESLMGFGIEVGSGWFKLINDLCEKIQTHCDELGYNDTKFTQIKEKWGRLRIYMNYADDFIYDLIYKAEEDSGHICEVCGSKRGKMRDDGWHMVRCKKCWEKYQEEIEERLNTYYQKLKNEET